MALSNPYNVASAITPSDTVNINLNTNLPDSTDAIWVGGAGIVVAVLTNDRTANFTCTAGTLLPIKAKRVNATTTTATLMVALYMD
jgi:hypothetical protein